MRRTWNDLRWDARQRKWVPLYKVVQWRNLQELNLVCEVCEGLLNHGERFCSKQCFLDSFHLPESGRLVEELKKRVEAGTYQVDALEVADAILDWGGQKDPTRGRRWRQIRLAQLLQEVA